MQRRGTVLLAALIAVVTLVTRPTTLPAQARPTAASGIGAIDESARVTLKGNRHPLATPENDRGAVSPDLPMERMLLVLQRDPATESSLQQLLAAQQDKSSPGFHAWLSPEQFAAQFSPAQSDVKTLADWLASHGFRINRVARGGMAIEFSGTAGHVQEAFHTAIHSYVVDGAMHYANASDPQIPAVFAPMVAGVSTLHNFQKSSAIRVLGTAARIANTSAWQPNFTFQSALGVYHYLAPGDFAKIYNTASLYKSGIDGTGQSIAIVGRSNLFLSDIQIFRIAFGLPANDPQIILDGPDPGDLFGSEEGEADLDVEWSGAIAPKATIKFVVSASTNTTDGADLSAEYIVDNNLAPVLSTSFGQCEAQLGQAENTFYNNLWEQAAAEGITVVVASGDSGAAGCDNPDFVPATQGAAVSGLASTPFNIAVGGTEFNENGAASTYWSPTNAADQSSVLSYIPEAVWNESCSDISQCASVTLLASGGGASSLYQKPSWQAGPGVPSNGKRDLPDVSLAAAAQHDGFLLCQDGTCLTDGQGRLYNAEVVGGTSTAAPTFAAIMALVNQNTKSRQGQANFVLYPLAAAENAANCNASAPPQATCIFNDITQGNNTVPGQPGASAAPGYDLATGLGSVNAANLVTNWNNIAFRGSSTTLTLSPATITHGQAVSASVTVAPTTGSGTPTGGVALLTGGPQSLSLGSLTGGTLSSSLSALPGGSYTATAVYGGDGTFGSSVSAGVPLTVNPEPSTLAFSASASSITYSALLNLQASVAGASKQGIATGTVTFSDAFNGTAATLATVPLNIQGNLSLAQTSLAIGTHSLTASYSGDPSFHASSAGPLTVAVAKGPTTTQLFLPTGVPPNSTVVLQAVIFPTLGAGVPSGTVQFFNGTTALGTPVPVSSGLATLTTSRLANGANSISAAYSGDSNFNPSTSSAVSVFVGNPDFQIGVNPGNVTVSSTTPGTSRILVSPGPGLGFAGAVSFTCSGLPSGASCSFQPATLTLDGFTPLTTTLTISDPTASASLTHRAGEWPMLAGSLGSISLACSLLLILPGKKRARLCCTLLFLVGMLGALGCSGGSSSSTSTGTTTSTTTSYVVVVTATGGSGALAVSHSVSLSVAKP
jgi:Pro-kumamolisin, activation domain/Bacterial Ig-like domain (group 3)